jgi:putative spermidine/putrescine transport system substrate-binding protein
MSAVAIAGILTQPADAASNKDLTIVSWGGDYTRSQMLAYVKPFRAAIDEYVAMERYNGGLKEITEQVEAANITWDVIDLESSDLLRACQDGLLEKFDHSALPAGDDGTAAVDDFIAGSLTECGVGQTLWSTIVAYSNNAVGGGKPSSIGDFFDIAKFPGKRGLRRDPRVNMEWALLADGVAAGDIYKTLETPDGVDRALKVLNRIRGNIVWWDAGSEPVELLRSGEVVMTSAWNGRMFRPIVEKGEAFTILWDGQVWDIDSWGIVKGTDNLEKAIAFVRFATDTQRLAEQTKYISYGPARRSSMAKVGTAVLDHLPTAENNIANALQINAGWWAVNKPALEKRFEAWIRSPEGRGPLGTAR